VKRWQFWLGIAISAVFLFVALRDLKLEEVWGYLRSANYLWLIPGIAVYFVAVVVRTWRWGYLLRPLKRIPVKRLFPVVVIGYMGNNIFPFRIGELLRAYVLKRDEDVSISSSLATIVVERIFDGLTMLLFAVIALLAAPFLSDMLRLGVLLGGLIFLGALGVFLFLAARPATAARLYNPLIDRLVPHRFRDKLRGFIERFMHGLAALRDFKHVLLIFATSIGIWLLETVMYWLVMQAFSLQLSFFTLMLMNGVVNLVTTLPTAPGGLGTFEASGIWTLEAFGVLKSRATAYTLILHATLWLPITLLGFYYMIREGLRWGDLAQASHLRESETTTT
jgi:glycosyltransferase 2 family protein